jgi:hypothetical protein
VSSTCACGVKAPAVSKLGGAVAVAAATARGARRGRLLTSHAITLPMIGTHSTISSVAMSRVVVPGVA